MGNFRLAKHASFLVFLAAVTLAPGTASAGWPEYPGQNGYYPSAGYSVPMLAADPYAGPFGEPACSGCSYTVPLVAVYQCPAKIVGQRGSEVVYLRTSRAAGLLGGRPFLYHN